ncbi:MAG TPA: polysaccharide deacetylase family protein [Acidobacteriaceae bacterium]
MKLSSLPIVSALVLSLFVSLPAAAQQKIAFTWDDLPAHSSLPPGETRQQVIDALIHTIQTQHMPAPYGFINAKAIESQPELIKVLDAWRTAGFPLGNHTWSHLNLNAPSTTVDAWGAEVLQNEPMLKKEMRDADFHWLRYPNLAEGETAEKKAGARHFLSEHGYKIAGVTMSFADYAYNDPYSRCIAKGDTAAVKLLEDNYLKSAADNLDYAHAMSMALYGHDIPYVLLMHVGALDAKLLPRLVELYRKHGVMFISLQEASKDPFYKNNLDLSLEPHPDTLEEAMHLKGLPLPKREPLTVNLATICRE